MKKMGLVVLLVVGSVMLTATAFAGEVISNNSKWAKEYPEQFETWKMTAKSDKITDMLEEKPQLVILWAGYGFAKDYNAPRGHFYALQSNQNTLRTGAPVDSKTGPMPTACWTCKSPDVVRMIDEDGENEYFTGKWAKYGDEISNQIGCADCHDSGTAELVLSRDYAKRALQQIGYDTDKLTEDDLVASADALGTLVQRYPGHRKTPEASYKLAMIFQRQGRSAEAKALLQKIVDEYGVTSTDTVNKANAYLDENFR